MRLSNLVNPTYLLTAAWGFREVSATSSLHSQPRALLPPPTRVRAEGACRRTRPARRTSGMARAMNPPSVPGTPFDQLPADLIVHVAVQLCSGPGLTRMECTCSAWRAAIRSPGPEEMLWKLVTLEKFPRIERVIKVKPTTKTWREIYRSLHRTAPVAPPKPKAEDFVLNFELKKGEQMLAEGAGQLMSPPEDAEYLESAPLWEPEQAPKLLRDGWDNPGNSLTIWDNPPHPLLSIWVTRDLQTVPLYFRGRCEDGDVGVSGKPSLGYYEVQEPPEIPHLSSVFNSPIREATLQVDFDEADGSVTLFMSTCPEFPLEPVDWSATSILEYLDALVPRSCTPYSSRAGG